MNASVAVRPALDRVDRVKATTGHPAQPGDQKLWILGGNSTFMVDGRVHCVPVGFVADGAALPRLGRLLTGHWWNGPKRWPVVCHDWLCSHPMVVKSYADAALRALLHSEGARWWSREALYFSTRWFGGRAFALRNQAGPMIYDKGDLMDDLPDDAPTLELAATRSSFIRSTPEGPPCDTVRFEATGRTYADLRQTATDVLTALLGEARVEGRIQLNLEIEPDANELGSDTPVAWRAEVTAVIPSY